MQEDDILNRWFSTDGYIEYEIKVSMSLVVINGM